ncbi:uncharacterized protein LOC113301558 [Papaver somniferum]|uniref:uncharacterized protein LOC113301558 n=1 Tax=Papaver somniferum TaxID=3469 RepID=UPI000E6F7483|nr:uncharacterized protein LOC113301558 [Papaver somniferum]
MATSSSDAISLMATTSASADHTQGEAKGGLLVGLVQALGMIIGADSLAVLKDGTIVTDKEEQSVDAALEAKRIYTSDQFVLAGSGTVDFVREVAGTLERMSVSGDGDNLVNVFALASKVEEQLKDAVLKGMDDKMEFLLVGWDDRETLTQGSNNCRVNQGCWSIRCQGKN